MNGTTILIMASLHNDTFKSGGGSGYLIEENTIYIVIITNVCSMTYYNTVF